MIRATRRKKTNNLVMQSSMSCFVKRMNQFGFTHNSLTELKYHIFSGKKKRFTTSMEAQAGIPVLWLFFFYFGTDNIYRLLILGLRQLQMELDNPNWITWSSRQIGDLDTLRRNSSVNLTPKWRWLRNSYFDKFR